MRVDAVCQKSQKSKIVTSEARPETQKNNAKSQIEQNHMGHAMTSQINLSADTDKARSFSRNYKMRHKMEWQMNKKERKVLQNSKKKEIDQQVAEY